MSREDQQMTFLLLVIATALGPAPLPVLHPAAPLADMMPNTTNVDPDAFWTLVERSRAGHEDCDSQAAALGEHLRRLSPEQIVQFDRELRSRLIESYRWDLWGVAYLVNGGASDDGFEYFRGWLIAQGRDYFESALLDPQRAAQRAEPGEAECEAILYVAAEAYETNTGEELPQSDLVYPKEPAGQPWNEEELEDLFPAVAQSFG